MCAFVQGAGEQDVSDVHTIHDEHVRAPAKEEDAIATEINLPIEALVDKIALELTNRQPRLKCLKKSI